MVRSNVVFILIDDLGWRDLACYGSSFYETPHLDELSRQGMMFTRAYASCPVCSPTRASIMTGKYPARLGLTQWIGGSANGRVLDVPYIRHLPLEETSLATALREGGYQTWCVGKWHLGSEPYWPQHHGFDVNLGGCHWGRPMNGYFSPWGNPTLPDGRPGEYLTDHLTDRAIGLIRDRRGDAPFFLYLAHHAMHIPIQAPEPLVEKYRRKAAAMKLDQVNPLVEGQGFPFAERRDHRLVRRVVQSDPAYAAMIENLDTNIGRLMAALHREGLAERTLVVFVSDNGGLSSAEGAPTCNHPLSEGKGWNYEGGTRVCQIVRWPGRVAPDSRCHVPVTSTDFYPTILAAAGLPRRPAQHRDGVSLLPLLAGGDRLDRRAIFWHYPHYSNQGNTPAAAVVEGDYKLIEFFEDSHLELYDLADDPGEHRSLADERPELRDALHEQLRAWQRDVSAVIPQPNPNWRP